MTTTAPTAMGSALDAARRGWRLIRLQPGGKTPSGPWRGRDTSNPATIMSWWTGDSSPNYGIVADASGLVILDEDTPGALAQWETENGPLPATYTVTTGKGRHLYFATGARSYSNRSPFRADGLDVDVRGAGYVVGPGSTHGTTGAIYTVVDDRDPAPIPPALHDYLTSPIAPPPDSRPDVREHTTSDRWLSAAIRGALTDLADVAALPEGATDRNGKTWETGALHARACRLVELSNADPAAYPLEQARADYIAAAPAGHEKRFAHHWDDAAKRIAGRAAERPPQEDPDRLTPEEVRALLDGIDHITHEEDTPTAPASPGRFDPLDWTDVLTGPAPTEEWVLWPLAERGQSVSLYSAPKVGKSLLLLDMLAHAAAGQNVLGRPAAAPIKVLYLDAENTRKDLRKRLSDMHATPEMLEHITYLSFPPIAPLDTARGAAELLALADQHQPDVLIIDTVSRFIDGPENDADTWLSLYRHSLAPLKARQIAVIRLDHTGKDADRGERGSSAKNGDVDASWQLTYDKARQTRTLVRKLTRTGNGPERLVLNILRQPLRHEPASPLDASADPVSHLVRKLDELGADPGIGFKLAGPLLRDNGHGGFRNDLLREALRIRKARKGDPEGDPARLGNTPLGSPSQGDPAPGSPQHETPGQRVPPTQGTPRVTPTSAPRDPGSPLPKGEPVGSPPQEGRSPALCDGCGNPLPTAVSAGGHTTHPACQEPTR